MSPEDRLAAFLLEDAAPAHPSVDALFVAQVMQKVARRELGARLATAAATAVAASAVLWACAPVLDMAVHTVAPVLAPAAGVLAFALTLTLLGDRMLARR
jgi:protein-S-isoprenylcysteine O-methyltransferase Ste14